MEQDLNNNSRISSNLWSCTIWARDFPAYQSKQLGTNFTGRNSIGGLLVALGSNPNIPMGKVMSLLTKCVKKMRSRDWLCEELEQYLEDQTEKLQRSNTAAPTHQQQQHSKKKPTTSTSTKTITNPANPHTDTNSTNNNTTDNSTIKKYFNPLNAIPIIISSQDDKDDSKDVEDLSDRDLMEFCYEDSDQDPLEKKTEHVEEKKTEPSPSSPFKAFANLASKALDFFADNPGGSPYPSPNTNTAGGDSGTN
jgi:hypothetical protein